MYESEANGRVEPAWNIPTDVIAAFGRLNGRITMRTVLPWSEHCTECVWPTCYTTCDLYSPREDGKCRRFVDGMVRVVCPIAVNGYLLKIRFKQWGKLWTPASLNLRPSSTAHRIELRDRRLGTLLYKLPIPMPVKRQMISKRYSWKKKQATHGDRRVNASTSFLLECYNPANRIVNLSLTIRSMRREKNISYQKLLPLNPGFQLVRIPSIEISSLVDLDFPFNIELIPNDFEGEITLYFGLMEFVQEAQSGEKSEKIKCVVWDMDNTLWEGVLIEDGPDRVMLAPGIKNVLEELDRRGIVQSIASKNNHDDAVAVLKRFGLDELFLYPQISWAPKSEAIATIARQLNIGLDALLFIDDQEFERRQVEASVPGVKTLDARYYLTILGMEEFRVTVTAESMNRRKMYRVEQERLEIQNSFKDDYKAFLKHCNILLTVTTLANENLERVHELTQRTNQMNFSGSRYDRAVLREIMQSPYLDTYVMACEDRFGSYGIVGFGIVDKREPRLTDLMFSCRIQSKRVEHAFLRLMVVTYTSDRTRDFYANYRQTPRNIPAGKVFEDLGMYNMGVNNGVTSFVFPRNGRLVDDGIINVRWQGRMDQRGLG
jgi:FkbH-like protein